MHEDKDAFVHSWEKVTPFFYWFSRFCESKARNRSLAMSGIRDRSNILIIAPPTEFFVDRLLWANPSGENRLVYFSERMKNKGAERINDPRAHTSLASGFDKLPYEDGVFDVVFAYCFLDFLGDGEIKTALDEIKRVLRSGGKLLGTYLAPPRNVLERASSAFLTRLRFLTGGLRVVDVAPVLRDLRFEKVESLYCSQKGLPIGLVYARNSAHG